MVVSSIVLMIDGDGVGIFGGGSDSLNIFVVVCQGFFNHLCFIFLNLRKTKCRSVHRCRQTFQ